VTEPQDDGAALSALARQRSQTYWWLSELYLAAPDGAAVARLRDLAGEASAGDDAFPLKGRLAEMAAALAEVSPAALAIEHARLFAGLGESYGPAPPFESMHAGIPTQGDSTPSMVDAYRAAGFERIDVPAVPQDHLAVELRFMALLAAQESVAWDQHKLERLRAVLGHQQRFLDAHLLAWVPAYCERIATESREPFFAAVARMTGEALALDRANIDDLLRAAANA
jgi:putative dimethyl sulfoxide reductase chaperone